MSKTARTNSQLEINLKRRELSNPRRPDAGLRTRRDSWKTSNLRPRDRREIQQSQATTQHPGQHLCGKAKLLTLCRTQVADHHLNRAVTSRCPLEDQTISWDWLQTKMKRLLSTTPTQKKKRKLSLRAGSSASTRVLSSRRTISTFQM